MIDAGEGQADSALATSVVIVNYRTKALTQEAIASVLGETEVLEIVVVDNDSGDGSAEHLEKAFADPAVRVVRSATNVGFGAAVNLAAKQCRSPLMLVLNSDATLMKGSLRRLACALLADTTAGVIAPAVYEDDGRTLQPAAFGRLPRRTDIIVRGGWTKVSGPASRPGWISGVAMLFRRADFLAIGGFDEDFEMYFEDIDLCRRLHASGRSVLRDATAGVIHHGGKSWQSTADQRRRFHRSKLRYFEIVGATSLELQIVRWTSLIRMRSPS